MDRSDIAQCVMTVGVIDDLLIYRINEEEYLIIVSSAARRIWTGLKAYIGDIELVDISDDMALLEAILERLTNVEKLL